MIFWPIFLFFKWAIKSEKLNVKIFFKKTNGPKFSGEFISDVKFSKFMGYSRWKFEIMRKKIKKIVFFSEKIDFLDMILLYFGSFDNRIRFSWVCRLSVFF